MATSMVTRAEAELFGVSTPRFSVRVYIDKSFLSLRRSHSLQTSFSKIGWARSRAEKGRRIAGITVIDPQPTFPPPGIIADCVLQIPNEFHNSHYIVKTDLHTVYGEAPPSENGQQGSTPYVQHFWTTSLCGHAAIFICSMLLYSELRAVHAPSEIAAVLRDDALDEILIIGLSPKHVSDYFRRVGANAVRQRCPDLSDGRVRDRFVNAVRAYVLAGMPVIKAMDINLLNKNSGIYRKGGVTLQRPASAGNTPEDHFIVIIGAGLAHEDAQELVFHDPGTLPYLTATASELADASSWWLTEDGVSRKASGWEFQPVTPSRIRMPLHSFWADRDNCVPVLRRGLYSISNAILRMDMETYAILRNDPRNSITVAGDWSITREYYDLDAMDDGEFRLVQGNHLLNDEVWRHWLGIGLPDGIPPKMLQGVQTASNHLFPEHWYWIQRFIGSLWIWDAEMEPPTDTDPANAAEVLVAVVSDSHASPLILKRESVLTTVACNDLDDNAPKATHQSVAPEVSLVTSFVHGGVSNALEEWPNDVAFA